MFKISTFEFLASLCQKLKISMIDGDEETHNKILKYAFYSVTLTYILIISKSSIMGHLLLIDMCFAGLVGDHYQRRP